MKKISILLLVLCVFSSCDKKGPDVTIDNYTTYHFTMINNSGVQVAVVAGNKDFPDSLVLVNGTEYKWVMYSYDYTWPLDGRYAPKVYFDEDILVAHNYDDISDRNPGSGSNYKVIKTGEFAVSETFTFTPEDYQNALKQQK